MSARRCGRPTSGPAVLMTPPASRAIAALPTSSHVLRSARSRGRAGSPPAEKALLDDVAVRVTRWSEVEPWYSHTEAKVRESRATEAVLNAFVLSYREPGKQSELRKRALENLWTVQRADGGFDWLHFDLAPWETDESDLFGSCLAAVAVSIGPSPEAEKNEPLRTSRDLSSRKRCLEQEPPQSPRASVGGGEPARGPFFGAEKISSGSRLECAEG